jgi:hypothetical protein
MFFFLDMVPPSFASLMFLSHWAMRAFMLQALNPVFMFFFLDMVPPSFASLMFLSHWAMRAFPMSLQGPLVLRSSLEQYLLKGASQLQQE